MLHIIFAHYNAQNQYDDYVDYYINQLLCIEEEKKITFVSTSLLPRKVHQLLSNKGVHIIERENIGYDFYSYKVGIEHSDISEASSVLICNDSVFGPLYDINDIYSSLKKNTNDIISMTHSYENGYHLQSYFILFKNNCIHSDAFKQYWENVRVLSGKDEVIEKYELGLSIYFLQHGYKLGAFCELVPTFLNMILYGQKKYKTLLRCVILIIKGRPDKVKAINVTHYLWEMLITQQKFSFIKRDLIDKNPQKLSLSHLPQVVKKHTNYPVSLLTRKQNISKHPVNHVQLDA